MASELKRGDKVRIIKKHDTFYGEIGRLAADMGGNAVVYFLPGFWLPYEPEDLEKVPEDAWNVCEGARVKVKSGEYAGSWGVVVGKVPGSDLFTVVLDGPELIMAKDQMEVPRII